MKIAIVGSGISGLACAYYLHRDHEVHVYESEARIGGHTATVDVSLGTRSFALDTGFIVFNDWTYPNFIALLKELGITGKATEMSFSVSDQSTGLEFAGSNLNTLFSQRKNIVSPRFLGMLRDIVRFNKEAVVELEQGAIGPGATLGDYLQSRRYGSAFIEQYLVPMGSAIWSSDTRSMLDFPLLFFVRFFKNHGLLSVTNRPQWRVIEGGSREYLGPLTAGFADNIHCNAGIASVQRGAAGATLVFDDGSRQEFDHVVMACHSDQALGLLDQPTQLESDVLAAMPYQSNDVVLHTDVRLLPRSRRAWSSWNYVMTGADQPAAVTYNMNILQGLDAPETFCVTLNCADAINPNKILARYSYDHPVFSLSSMRAQDRWHEINGDNTWYCGAYWHNGFHEDGVNSALRVAQAIAEMADRAEPKLGVVA
jgi:predicted NAD/FAD-binding protein